MGDWYNPFDDEKGHGFNGGTASTVANIGTFGGYGVAKQLVGGSTPASADPNAHVLAGDPAYAKNTSDMLYNTGAVGQGRQAPAAAQTYAATTPYLQGVTTAQGNVGTAAQGVGGAADQLGRQGNVSNAIAGSLYQQGQRLGEGQGLVGRAGNGLLALGQMPAGPSAAELAMRAQGQQAVQQQAALAAGARGGNSALALQNAAANSASIGGNLAGQVGIQRAQEDMANRQFSANALSGAASIFGNQNQQALGATQAAGAGVSQAGQLFGAQGQTYGAQGQLGLGQGQLGLGAANVLTNQGTAAANLYLQNQGQNDAYQLGMQNQGNQLVLGQGSLSAGMDAANMQAQAAAEANDAALRGQVIGAVGAAAAPKSDKRAKKNIKPAGDEIDELFRNAPGYSYEYIEPDSPGAKPGQNFGPMAQDLEKTRAGASVVGTDANGEKRVDTGRLSLMTTSEVGKQRAQIDALARAVFGKKRAA